MNNFFIKSNLSTLTKLCLAGLFTALATILQKVVAINYIPVVPFLRISLGGPAIIIFSSILLGPWYGLLVGVGSDVLGYFALDFSGYAYFPQVTAIYGLLGFLSYFVFCLFKNIKNKKVMIGIELACLAAAFIGVSLFVGLNDSMTMYSSTYTFETWQKILIPVLLFVLLAGLFVFVVIYDKKKKDNPALLNTYQLSLALFVLEVVVMVIFGTIMKGWAFGFGTYFAILICQIVVLFVNVPLNTVLVSLLLKLTEKKFVKTNVKSEQ